MAGRLSELRRSELRRKLLALAPAASGVVLVLLAAVPLPVGHIGEAMPKLGLAAVFFWAAHRPDLMTCGAAFVIGLVADLATGAPLAISALVLLAVRQAVSVRRRFFVARPFRELWAGFALVAPLAAALDWALSSLYLLAFLAPGPVLFQTALTVLLFPPLAWLFARHQAALPLPRLPVPGYR